MPDPGVTCANCQQIMFSQKDEHAEEECAQRCQRPDNLQQPTVCHKKPGDKYHYRFRLFLKIQLKSGIKVIHDNPT